MSLELDERRRLAAERRLAQLGRAPRHAERGVDRRLVRRVRERLERRDVRRPSRSRDERGPEPLRLGDDELDRHALDRDADRAAAPPARQRRRSAAARRSASSTAPGPPRRNHREPLARVAPARGVAGQLAAERGRDAADELARAVEQQPAARPRLLLAGERLEQPRLGLRPDAGHGAQPPGRGRLAQLLGGADAERPGDLHRAPRGQPEVAAEPDEVRRELALELRQLRDLARLDELAQPRLDPRPDPAQLAHPARAHELGDRDGRAADRLGRRAGTRASCTGSRRLARAATRTRPGGRRSRVVHGRVVSRECSTT